MMTTMNTEIETEEAHRRHQLLLQELLRSVAKKVLLTAPNRQQMDTWKVSRWFDARFQKWLDLTDGNEHTNFMKTNPECANVMLEECAAMKYVECKLGKCGLVHDWLLHKKADWVPLLRRKNRKGRRAKHPDYPDKKEPFCGPYIVDSEFMCTLVKQRDFLPAIFKLEFSSNVVVAIHKWSTEHIWLNLEFVAFSGTRRIHDAYIDKLLDNYRLLASVLAGHCLRLRRIRFSVKFIPRAICVPQRILDALYDVQLRVRERILTKFDVGQHPLFRIEFYLFYQCKSLAEFSAFEKCRFTHPLFVEQQFHAATTTGNSNGGGTFASIGWNHREYTATDMHGCVHHCAYGIKGPDDVA